MSLVIREMCPDDRQEVQALLRAVQDDDSSEQGGPQPAEKILHEGSSLSLIASEEGKIIAAMVCDRDGQCGYLHHLPQAEDQPQSRDDVAKALVDKTMRKLNARGVGKFRIDLPQDDAAHPLFWDEVRWGDVGGPNSSDEVAGATAEPALEETGPVTQPQTAE